MNNLTVWEYQILPNPTQAQLADLGREGWELVAVTCIVSGFSRDERAFLKRLQPAGVPPLLAPAR